MNILDIFQNGKSNMKSLKSQRAANCLKWRQLYQNCPEYCITLADDRVLTFSQIDNGELRGLGTGAVVWPAAHVLAKYLEKRYGVSGLNGKRVIDIGSGTGVVGVVAAHLGATVILSDQTCVKDLLQSNIDRYLCEIPSSNPPPVRFAEYNWDESPSSLDPPFDLVLVSDCVLPKLYPIEPLIQVCSTFSYAYCVTPVPLCSNASPPSLCSRLWPLSWVLSH
jgi:hypothetical protein